MESVKSPPSLKGETVYLTAYALGLGVLECKVLRGPSRTGRIEVHLPGCGPNRLMADQWCRAKEEALARVAQMLESKRVQFEADVARERARLDAIGAGLAKGELPAWG